MLKHLAEGLAPSKNFFYVYEFICLWLRWVSVAARELSLAAASGDCSQAAVWGLLIVVASLFAEHGL